ncbi:MAG: DNA topoisomerase (ATP-hydrolyzing) subunit A [Planctomycetes bacterium]|nr:DNA topoisomerase (ATP-hydrolyzing) subunit A [Planctomycetota bacterium]
MCSRELTVEVQDELKESYLNYAMSVIVSRALPDVRDGLKPSQRRILVAMNDLGLSPQAKTRKCAKICGDTSGNYHPHGEQVIYPTLVRMAQDFSLRYPLIIGQGNFGSIDGDPPAQMRYTEAKLSPAAVEMLDEIEEDTVNLVPNYDETRQEPVVLPSRFPNLLVNGTTGIAVGMSTSMPSHNIGEICDSLLLLLDNPQASIDQIFNYFNGPDFPTGGIIHGRKQLKKMYEEGKGVVRIRAKAHVEEGKTEQKVILTEIPYGITKADLIKDLVDQVNEGQLNGIDDIRDESDKKGIRVVISVVKGMNAEYVLQTLFEKTRLELSFSINFIVLRDKTPVLLGLRELLQEYLNYRREVILRRTKFRLSKAKDELHIKEGILKALDVIDEIINIIRKSHDQQDAKNQLIERFKFSEKQVEAILKITLARLTRLERETITKEIAELTENIAKLTEILEKEERLKGVVSEEIIKLSEKFRDARRTEIIDQSLESKAENAEQSVEDVFVIITKKGFWKRAFTSTLSTRKSLSIQDTRNQDEVTASLFTQTNKQLLLFSNTGRAFGVMVNEIPVADKGSRGKSVSQWISLKENEHIVDAIALEKLEGELMFISAKGYIKKTQVSDFTNAKKAGIAAINVEEDSLVRVIYVDKPSVILVSSDDKIVKFDLNEVREMGRQSRGVRGINLGEQGVVTDAVLVDEKGRLILANNQAYCKIVSIDEVREQSRGGKGIVSGGAKVCGFINKEEEVGFVTAAGTYNLVKVAEISSMSRTARGKRLIELEGDKLVRIITKS